MQKLICSLAAASAAAVLAVTASGSPTEYDSSQSSPYTVSSSDAINGLSPVYQSNYGGGWTNNAGQEGIPALTDGVAPSNDTETASVGSQGVGPNGNWGGQTLIYTISPTTLSALNFYFYWSDGGRDIPCSVSIATNSASTNDPSNAGWTPLYTTSGNYDPANIYSEVSVADSASIGDPIATGVQSIEITFGTDAENGWVGLGEIDAIAAVPEPATVALVGVVCCVGLLRRRCAHS